MIEDFDLKRRLAQREREKDVERPLVNEYVNPDRIEDWKKSGGEVWQTVLKERRAQNEGVEINWAEAWKPPASSPVEGPQLSLPPYTKEASLRESIIRGGHDDVRYMTGLSSKDVQLLAKFNKDEFLRIVKAADEQRQMETYLSSYQVQAERQAQKLMEMHGEEEQEVVVEPEANSFWSAFRSVIDPVAFWNEAAYPFLNAMAEGGITVTKWIADTPALPFDAEGNFSLGWNRGGMGSISWLWNNTPAGQQLQRGWNTMQERVTGPTDLDPWVKDQMVKGVKADMFDRMETEAPEAFEEYMEMAQGDRMKAMGFFGADLAQPPADGKSQVEQIEDYIEQDWIETLDRNHNSPAADVMEWLSVWGEISSANATIATLFLTDEDMMDIWTDEGFRGVLSEASKHDYRPSKVLGWDGTVVGVGLDLAGMMAFSPDTWILGPTGKGISLMDDAAKVAKLRTNRVFMRHVDDVVEAAGRGDNGFLSLILSDLDETGVLDDVLDFLDDARVSGYQARLTQDQFELIEALRKGQLKVTNPAGGAEGIGQHYFTNLNRPDMAQRVWINGRNVIVDDVYELRRAPGAGGAKQDLFWYNTDTGEVVAGISWDVNATGGGLVWSSESVRGKGMLDRALGLWEQSTGESPLGIIANLAGDGSITPEGMHWLNQQARKYRQTFIPQNIRQGIEDLLIKHVELGGDILPRATQRRMRLMEMAEHFESLRKTKGTRRAVREMITPATTSRYIPINQPGGFGAALDQFAMLFGGRNPERMKHYVDRAVQLRTRARQTALAQGKITSKVQQTQEYQKLLDAISRLRVQADGTDREVIERLWRELRHSPMDQPSMGFEGVEAAHREAWETAKEIRGHQRAINDMLLREASELGVDLGESYVDDMQKLINEAYFEFNREFIAPLWTKRGWLRDTGLELTEDGLVPWEAIAGRRGSTADNAALQRVKLTQKIPFTGGTDAAAKAAELFDDAYNLAPVLTPAAPLEMIAAASRSGNRLRRAVNNGIVVDKSRAVLDGLDYVWKMDKVVSAATAAAVSVDELLSAFHRYGWGNTRYWLYDRINSLQERITRATTGKARLTPAQERRMAILNDVPGQLRMAESSQFDQVTREWNVITPDLPGYEHAARSFYTGLIDDPSFRAFLQGDEALEAYVYSAEGRRFLRPNSLIVPKGAYGAVGVDEVRKGWEAFLETLWREVPAKQQKALREWLTETATNYRSAAPTGMPRELAKDAGYVLGPHTQKSGMLTRLTESLFNSPTYYRRGFLNDVVRRQEARRLTALYQSKGYKVVSNAEAERIMASQGVDIRNADFAGSALVDQKLAQQGIISERFMDRLLEKKVLEEIDRSMYVWQRGTRAGEWSKHLAPFGKPWFDMAARWGRESTQRPVARGWIRNSNIPGMKKTAEIIHSSPFNPKPAFMMSRLANMNLDIDKGWVPWDEEVNEGLLPGTQSSDLSRVLFLPTQGDNAFGMILPGVGYLPQFAVHGLIELFSDDLLEAEQTREAIGQFVYGFDWANATDPNKFLFGTGNISRAAQTIEAGASMATGSQASLLPFTFLQDPYRQSEILRHTSALLVQPDGLQELLTIKDPELLALQVKAIGVEAARNASSGTMMEYMYNWATPARHKQDSVVVELYDVWAQAGQKFTGLGVVPDKNFEDMTPDERAEYGNKVRQEYHRQPEWKQNLMVAAYPEIAANLAGAWEWSDLGRQALGEEAMGRYFPGVDATDDAKHQRYIDQGYIKPRDREERIFDALGIIERAKRQTLQNAYSFTVREFNDWQWDNYVSEDTKAFLEGAVSDPQFNPWGLESGKELWLRWGSLEDDLERIGADLAGVAEDDEEGQEFIRGAFKIPQETIGGLDLGRAWSETGIFPGTENIPRQAFMNLPEVMIPEETREIFETMGWEMGPMTGEAFWGHLAGLRDDENAAVWSYIAGTSTINSEPLNRLKDVGSNPDIDEEYRQTLRDFVLKVDMIKERAQRSNRTLTREEVQTVRDDYNRLAMTGRDFAFSWDKIWEEGFERTFGKREWEPPEIPPIETGWQPYIRDIVDGDTLVVSTQRGPGIFANDVGMTKSHKVRLLGVMAPELGTEEGRAALAEFEDMIYDAVAEGKMITLVPDPDNYGTVDPYGRELAWIYIGDEPYYDEEVIQNPGGR